MCARARMRRKGGPASSRPPDAGRQELRTSHEAPGDTMPAGSRECVARRKRAPTACSSAGRPAGEDGLRRASSMPCALPQLPRASGCDRASAASATPRYGLHRRCTSIRPTRLTTEALLVDEDRDAVAARMLARGGQLPPKTGTGTGTGTDTGTDMGTGTGALRTNAGNQGSTT